MMLAAVISAMANHVLFPRASLHTSKAMADVAAISKLFKSAAAAALVFEGPIIKNMGAKTSSRTMAAV
jgi:hypothetical protein